MKFKKIIFVLLIALLNLSVCSAQSTQNDTSLQSGIELEEEEFLYEFEDEFSDDEAGSQSDPLVEYNRFMTMINEKLYDHIFEPVVDGYAYILHKEIRESINNFFNNLYFPPRLVNNLLQGKFKNATEESGRFLINSTIGFFGFFDVAKNNFDLHEHNEDFGQTLGFYGVGSGPHIVLPIFGPSNLRDSLGKIPDSYISPFDFKQREWFTVTDTWSELVIAKSVENTNSFSLNRQEYDKLRKDAVDLYPYMKNMYEQYREKQIKE